MVWALTPVNDPFTFTGPKHYHDQEGKTYSYFSSTYTPVSGNGIYGLISYHWQGRFWIIGAILGGSRLGQTELFFGKCADPSTKSITWKKLYLQSV